MRKADSSEIFKQNIDQSQHLLSDDNQLTTADAAKFLGLSPQTLNNWRHRRVGPPYLKYSARAVRYKVADLRKFVDQLRVTPEA